MIDMDPNKTFVFRVEGDLKEIAKILEIALETQYISSYEIIGWPSDKASSEEI